MWLSLHRSPELLAFVIVSVLGGSVEESSDFSSPNSQKDKRTGNPKIWIYRDKITNEPKGDATITYEDPHAATAAVEWFNSTEFHGNIISVSIAENKKDVQPLVPEIVPPMMDAPLQGVAEFGTDPNLGGEYSGDYGGEYGGEHGGGAGGPPGLAGGRGRGRGDGKPWQQEGDWPCPNPRSVTTLVSSIRLLHPSLEF